MLRLITGADDALKTEYAIEELVRRAVAEPERKFIFVVPEQFTLETQKNVLKYHPRHACMNIDVVSFNRLAVVVLSKLGISTADVLDETGKSLILRSVLDKCREELRFYKNKTHMEGFIAEMKSTISEFGQYGIDDNTLFLMQERAARAGENILYDKLQDIRLIYGKTLEEIKNGYTTADGILNLFERNIPDSDFLKDSAVYLDGFTGFTPVQLKIIEGLLKVCTCVACALTIPANRINSACSETDVFYLSSSTYFKLKGLAEKAGVPSEDAFVPDTEKSSVSVRIIKQKNAAAECMFAAAKITELVRDEGLRYRDIAVLTPDTCGYHPEIKRAFAEGGIPVFIDHKDAIPGNTLVRFLLSAIDIKTENMSHDSVFAFLKTGFAEISPDDLACLENYCLEFGIRGVNAWRKSFEANRNVYSTGEPYWDLERINAARSGVYEMLEGFLRFCKRSGDSAANYAAALKGLMETSGAEEKTRKLALSLADFGEAVLSEQYEQIYAQITELLDKITLLLGGGEMSLREFREILAGGLDEIQTGAIPPVLDVVTVGDLNRTRLGNVSVLFVLGCNDGKLPQVNAGAGLLSQYERSFLKEEFELAPDIFENLCMQQFYLYLCFNKPENILYLTWAAASDSGEDLAPSNLLGSITDLLPGAASVSLLEEDIPFPGQSAALKRFSRALCEYIKNETENEGTGDAGSLLNAARACPEGCAAQILDAAFFSNVQEPLNASLAQELYGSVLKGSISRFERYYECPYRHFLTYGLDLKERKIYEIQAADMGTIYHDALEKYSKKLTEEGLTFRTADDETSRRICDESVDEAIAEQPGDILDSTARNSFFQNRIKQIARKTTDALRLHVRSGRFEPEDFELRFTEKIAGDTIRFSGKIDRLDIYEEESGGSIFVKIIDYKSGMKEFSPEEIYDGVQLQLAAYMDQAIKETKRKHPDADVKPGGIYYYLINDKFVKNEKEETEKYRMHGLTLSDHDIPEAMDEALASAGAQSDIIEVSYDKNGNISSKSKVAGEEEFLNLIEFTKGRIEEAGKEILSGDISLRPWRENDKKSACTYCENRDVCKFEAGHFGTDWKERSGLDREDIERELYGGDNLD